MVGLAKFKEGTVIAGHQRVVVEREAKETEAFYVAVLNLGKSEGHRTRERDPSPAQSLVMPALPAQLPLSLNLPQHPACALPFQECM